MRLAHMLFQKSQQRVSFGLRHDFNAPGTGMIDIKRFVSVSGWVRNRTEQTGTILRVTL
jgi:hypothetical protein